MLVKFLHESYLIDLERRIVVENLSSKSIQESFVQELLGPTLSDWLYSLKAELERKYESTLNAVSDCEKKLKEIKDIDKDFTNEINGRKKEINKSLNKAYYEFFKLYNDSMDKLRYLIDERVFSHSVTEKEYYKELITMLKEQGEKVNQLYENTSNF